MIQPSETGTIIPVTGQYILENLAILEQNSVPVYRALKRADGTMKAEQVDPTLAKNLSEAERSQKLFLIHRDWKPRLFAAGDSFDSQLEPLLAKTAEERTQAVKTLKNVIGELKKAQAAPMVKARAIMDTVSQTFLLNKASLKSKPNEVTTNEKTLAKDTESIVGTALEMAEDPELVAGLFASF